MTDHTPGPWNVDAAFMRLLRGMQGAPAAAADEIDRLRNVNADVLAALEEIRNGRIPQVCEMYEICDHIGCAASYAAFAIADAAITKAKGVAE